jgi:1,4-alpha-glucan branching enzyme
VPPSSRFPNVTGATAYDGGVTFRVWAPFAQGVHVAGEFNGWSQTASALEPEGGGYWSADVPGAAPRQQYKFVVAPAGCRIDPCAKPRAAPVSTASGTPASTTRSGTSSSRWKTAPGTWAQSGT